MSDSGPPNPSPELEPQAAALNVPANASSALDILHFFTGVKSTRSKFSSDGEKPKSKICKACAYVWTSCYLFCLLTTSSQKYGTDKSKIPNDVPNFIYGLKTGNTNLRRHLHQVHPGEYDDAVLQHNWQYKLTSQLSDASNNARNQRDQKIPSFSPVSFLEHLVRFIVADDQVSSDDLVSSHTLKGL